MEAKYVRGKMNVSVELLGTGLKLSKGEFVRLVPATNIPNGLTKWYASSIHWDHDNSILIDAMDVTVRGFIPGRQPA